MSNSNSPRVVGIYDKKTKERVQNVIFRKQKGVCRHCNEPFKSADIVISTARNRKYYHIDCAVKLCIIDTNFMPKEKIAGLDFWVSWWKSKNPLP